MSPGVNIFRVNVDSLEATLKRVPAVAGATVARRLPNRIEVSIMPRIPVAVFDAGAERWEVDKTGVAIRPARPDAVLPEIDCMASEPVAAGQRIDAPGIGAALVAAGLTTRAKTPGIAKIAVDQNADMCLNMADSVAIRIGQSDNLETKLNLVARIYADRPGIASEVESIDLRFPEAPSCLPRGAAEAGSSSAQIPQPLDSVREHDDSARGSVELDGNNSPATEATQHASANQRASRRRGRGHRAPIQTAADVEDRAVSENAPGERR
jgi:cell division septal protein FtsQ